MKIKTILKIVYGNIIFTILKVFPIKNKVVFSSFSGKRYADNTKYVSIALYKEHPEIKQIWLEHKGYEIDTPEYIKKVKWPSIRMAYELATSKIWVDSHTKPLWVKKRKKQFFIETWHGGLGFKKIEGDGSYIITKDNLLRTKKNSEMADILTSNSEWLTDIYKRAFFYKGEIIKTGLPKNDIFFQKDKFKIITEKIKNQYSIPKKSKILLYAPTYRDRQGVVDYKIDLLRLYNILNSNNNEQWVIIFKLHPVLQNCKNSFLKEIEGKVLNATNYNDMQELIIACDMFITDYSSGIFGNALLKKPGFIYAHDMDEYNDKRGLYFDLRKNEVPFPVAENQEQLEKNIVEFNQKEYEENLDNFFESVKLCEDGKASQKITEIINKVIKNTYRGLNE